MSFSCHMAIDTGGDGLACVEDIGNYTGNVGRMWSHALAYAYERDISLDELGPYKYLYTGAELLPYLDRAVNHMQSYPEQYTPMNPPNGWGDYEGALVFLSAIRDACKNHPKAMLFISY